MKVYDLLKEINPKTIKKLVMVGVFPVNTQRDMDIYEKMKAYMTSTGNNVTDACFEIEAMMGKHPGERQIRTIYNRLNEEL